MNSIIKIAGALALLCCLIGEGRAQVTATTSDGRKVLLYPDGTWKYVFETDGRKVTLNPDGTWRYETVADTTMKLSTTVPVETMPIVSVDSIKHAPVKPPVKRVPLNLDCSALVAVERSIQGDRFVAQSKTIKVTTDSTTGFAISFYKSKNGPLIWTTAIAARGHCIKEENKMLIVMKDGTRYQVDNNGKPNCDGSFKLYFGGTYGKETQLESLQSQEIAAIKAWTSNSFVEETFSEDHSSLFKASINCMLATK
jgi:hypothetical protein